MARGKSTAITISSHRSLIAAALGDSNELIRNYLNLMRRLEMARKPQIRCTLAVMLMMVLVANGTGCASGRKSKAGDAGLSHVTPSRLPSVNVASDSSRLSGIQSSSKSASSLSPYGDGANAVNDPESPGSAGNTYSSSSSSRSGCSKGGCGSCRS